MRSRLMPWRMYSKLRPSSLIRSSTGISKLSINNLFESALGAFSVGELAKNLNAGDRLCFGHLNFATELGLTNTEPCIGSIHCHIKVIKYYSLKQCALQTCGCLLSLLKILHN